MARNPSRFAKMQRERERQRRRAERAQRKAERRDQKPDELKGADDAQLDPDIAHIVPGPQPKPWDDELDPADDAADRPD